MKHIVVILGYPASGKTTVTKRFEVLGYTRFNRDEKGGSIESLHNEVSLFLSKGDKVVVDNLYPTIESRKPLIDIAKKHGAEIECVWQSTSIEDCQVNAVTRMIQNHGKMLSPDEIKASKNPNDIPTAVLFKYKKEFQKPTIAEGFKRVTENKFTRYDLPKEYTNKALILDYDGTLRETISGEKFPRSVDDIKVLPGRKEKLQEYLDKGYILLGISNQSGIAKKQVSYQTVVDCFEKTNQLLGHKIDYRFCSHSVPPIICFCRKPMPGLGVELIHQYKLDPSQCIYVGDMTTDKTFSQRAGLKFVESSEFFK